MFDQPVVLPSIIEKENALFFSFLLLVMIFNWF